MLTTSISQRLHLSFLSLSKTRKVCQSEFNEFYQTKSAGLADRIALGRKYDTDIIIYLHQQDSLSFHSIQTSSEEAQNDNHNAIILRLIRKIINSFGKNDSNFEKILSPKVLVFCLSSQIPISMGLGSSASLIVCLYSAFKVCLIW